MGPRTHSVSDYPDHRAWAEMLAGFAEKNARLGHFVAKRCIVRSGPSLLAELERERSRIARELHAGAGQPLAGIKLHLEILNECTTGLPDSAWGNPARGESARVAIGRLQTLAEQALGQVRALSHRLHPPDWQQKTIHGKRMESLVESELGLSGRLRREARFPAAARGALPRCQSAALSLRAGVYLEYHPAFRCHRGDCRAGRGRWASSFDCHRQRSRIRCQHEKFRHWIAGDRVRMRLRWVGTASITSGPNGTKIRVSLPAVFGGLTGGEPRKHSHGTDALNTDTGRRPRDCPGRGGRVLQSTPGCIAAWPMLRWA